MISVIIPLHNGRKTIFKTLKSIFNQTKKDLEIIIVDDGSTDGAADIIPQQPEIKIIKQKKLGASAARNRGAKEARGEYLFFCDADIILKPDALQKLKQALDKNADAAYAYCSFKLGWKKMPAMPYDAEKLKQINYISTMSLLRRDDFCGFDEKLKRFQDWDLWLTLLEQGKRGVFVPEALFYAKPDRGISKWLPKMFYKFSWLPSVKKYNESALAIKEKHNL